MLESPAQAPCLGVQRIALHPCRLAGSIRQLLLKTREVWERYWQGLNIEKGPRIAFRWALLPTKQRFEPGDYNWGMTSFGLVPGEDFDLSLSMRMGDDPELLKLVRALRQ